MEGVPQANGPQMSVSLKQLGLENLSPIDRIELIGELWDSLSGELDTIPLSDAQRADLDRRLDAHADDPLAGDPWEVVRARIEGRQ